MDAAAMVELMRKYLEALDACRACDYYYFRKVMRDLVEAKKGGK